MTSTNGSGTIIIHRSRFETSETRHLCKNYFFPFTDQLCTYTKIEISICVCFFGCRFIRKPYHGSVIYFAFSSSAVNYVYTNSYEANIRGWHTLFVREKTMKLEHFFLFSFYYLQTPERTYLILIIFLLKSTKRIDSIEYRELNFDSTHTCKWLATQKLRI